MYIYIIKNRGLPFQIPDQSHFLEIEEKKKL